MSLFNQMQQAQLRFQLQLLAKANVVGVGVGYKDNKGEPTDEIALVALVEQKKPAAALTADDMIPPDLDGAKTDVVEVGVLRAYNSVNPRGRFRPTIPPGVSMGHYQVTAGTFGALVYDVQTGEALLLSNNHVFANSNDAQLGDVILQPGALDGGNNPGDVVAELYKYLPLRFTNEGNLPPASVIGPPVTTPPPPTEEPPVLPPEGNPTEPPPTEQPPTPEPPPTEEPPTPEPPTTPEVNGCAQLIISVAETLARMNDPSAKVVVQSQSAAPKDAVAVPVHSADASTVEAQAVIPSNPIDAALAKPRDPNMFSNQIRGIGAISGTRSPSLGMQVRKSGRTTDFTTGVITLVNATIDVGYSTRFGTRTVRFTGQVMTTPMSQGGDSGSLIVSATSQDAVGLLFAGSPQATIFSPIGIVMSTLGIRF